MHSRNSFDCYANSHGLKISRNATGPTSATTGLQLVHSSQLGSSSLTSQILAPQFIDAAALIRDNPDMRPEVVEGVLRLTEVMLFVAPPKARKSWLLLHMLLCIATGTPWLGFPVTQQRVLLLDFELHRQVMSQRLSAVAASLGIPPAAWKGMIQIEVFRDRPEVVDVNRLEESYFPRIKHGEFGVVGIDPIYKILAEKMDENSNADMARLMKAFERFATSTGAALVLVHHMPKGNGAERSLTDRAAGAGALTRACDTLVNLQKHEEEGHLVVDCTFRSFPSSSPYVIKQEGAIWHPAEGLDPSKVAKPGMVKTREQEDADLDSIIALIDQGKTTVNAIYGVNGMNKGRIGKLIHKGMKQGRVRLGEVQKRGLQEIQHYEVA